MENFTISHPIIQNAIKDLKNLLSDCKENIKSISLFGSTLKLIPIEDAKDIDFLIDYEGSYDELKSKIESVNIGRNVLIQHMKKGYANCPTWEKENPLRIHILFYEKGKTKLSPKAVETEKYALDITDKFL
jgi:predicted nucleotidyltransferase